MNLSNVWRGYQADKQIEGDSSITLKAYQLQSNLLIRYFGEIEIEDLTSENLKQYLSANRKDLKLASLGHQVRFIKSLFRWTHDEDIISKNPVAKLKEPKTGKQL
jgi:integrase/recombinase XerD